MKKSGYLQRLERKNELKHDLRFRQKMDMLQQMCVDAALRWVPDAVRSSARL